MNIQDSGNRREFDSGAVRDIAEGKGRCDLLPLVIVGFAMDDHYLIELGAYVETGDSCHLYNAYKLFTKNYMENIETGTLEVAKHYEDGCKKYGERNWEKGIPLHCFIDSAVRHYLKFKRGDTDERHDRAFLWNILGALWTMEHHPYLNDLPFNETTKQE